MLIPSAPSCIFAYSRRLDRYLAAVTGHVALPRRSIETRSLPTLTRSYPRHFTFYVAEPSTPFATLWTTIDPIGNVALFAALTAALTRSERHLTALRAVIYATIILVVAGVAGQIS